MGGHLMATPGNCKRRDLTTTTNTQVTQRQ